jgi:hypothetical protein
MSLKNLLVDKKHPKGSPLLGRFISSTVCSLGHNIVIMEHESWDEDWLTCSVCGARFIPASMIGEDTEVVRI